MRVDISIVSFLLNVVLHNPFVTLRTFKLCQKLLQIIYILSFANMRGVLI